mgnify:CR=1 FL=1|jgi:hypothetical protein|tara:strand:+ start:1571 stop:1924 length:354 start_codon:yes stop_codon:yes gene_type:complete
MNDRKTGFFRPTSVKDHSDGSVTFTTHQDVEPIIENNKLLQREWGDKLTPGKQVSGTRVASIPSGIWERWQQETKTWVTWEDGTQGWAFMIEHDPKLLSKYLNDPDNKFFRTTPTRV